MDRPLPAEPLQRFLALLERWNQRVNLFSRSGSFASLVASSLTDCAAVVALLGGKPAGDADETTASEITIADVGAGNGLLSIPLTLALPTANYELVEPRARRASFLRRAAGIATARVTVFDKRVEELPQTPRWDIALVRAVWQPSIAWERIAPLLKTGGRLVCLAGKETPLPSGDWQQLYYDELLPDAGDYPERRLLIRRR
ncbi:class I SAM-dependent methyltransferase [bacterium]|nr:class I SAM-dependent methyltransferase [bacterium]